MSSITYPLQLNFKIIAIAPQISVTDATGRLLLYVKQKAFKLKEKVTVFADQAQTRPLYTIGADRIIDFAAQYEINTAAGGQVGAVKRRGMRSIWRAHYDILRNGAPVMSIREENAWVKVLDHVLGELPVISMFTGYLFNPAYVVSRPDGSVALRVKKQPALLEGKFEVTKQGELQNGEEELAMLSVLMMLLLERMRG